MERGTQRRIWFPLVLVPVLVYAWVLFFELDVLLSGDARCTYLPTVWGLQDGKGFQAFVDGAHGAYRMPGYALTLWTLSTVLSIDALDALRVAGLLGLASVVYGLSTLDHFFRPRTILLGTTLLLLTPAFAEAAFQATPDLLCLGMTLVALSWSRSRRDSPTSQVVSGFASTLAVFLRLNALFAVVSAGWLAGRRRLFWLGASTPFLCWSVWSLFGKGHVFWIPRKKGANVGFHPDFVGSYAFPEQLLGAHPMEFFGRMIYRGLLSGPVEVSTRAIGIVPAVLWVLLLPRWREVSRSDRNCLFAMLLGSWILIAPIHFEARYYLFFAAVACIFSAEAFWQWADRSRKLGIALAVGGFLISLSGGLSAYSAAARSQMEDGRAAQAFQEWVAASDPSERWSADHLTCAYSPLRLVLRKTGRLDRLTCDGPVTGTIYVGRDVPPGWQRSTSASNLTPYQASRHQGQNPAIGEQ